MPGGHRRLDLGAEHDVPAEDVFDDPGTGDPAPLSSGAGNRTGPTEPDDADLRNPDLTDMPGQAGHGEFAALRDIHRHPGPDAALELRGARPAFPAVPPRRDIRLQDLLRGLSRENGQPADVLTGLPDRLIGLLQSRPAVPSTPRPPGVQQVPHRPRGMTLLVKGGNLPASQDQTANIPAIDVHAFGSLRHERSHRVSTHSRSVTADTSPTDNTTQGGTQDCPLPHNPSGIRPRIEIYVRSPSDGKRSPFRAGFYLPPKRQHSRPTSAEGPRTLRP